jgi:photosystem II stability/assembly factor-like uncharacterized protein
MALLQAMPAYGSKDLLEVAARQSAVAAKALLLGVALAGPRLVAVGERGIILYSDDSGLTWQQADVPVSVTLTAVNFPSASKGWAVGHDGVILHSSNGGKSWIKQFDGTNATALVLPEMERRLRAATDAARTTTGKAAELAAQALNRAQNALEDAKAGASFGPSRPLLGVWFRNESEGLVVGSYGQLFHTRDGGVTWESWGTRIANPDGLHFNDIALARDGALLIAGEAGNLYRSRDAGGTWETLATGYPGHLYGAIALAESKTLVAYGFGGNVFRSNDDGKTWQSVARVTTKPVVGGMLLPDGTLLLIDRERRQLVSHDQGVTFVLKTKSSGAPISRVLPSLVQEKLVAAGLGGVTLLAYSAEGR